MAVGTVQFREDDEVIRFVKAQGLNPNELARDAFASSVRRLRAERAMERLAKNRVDLGDVVRLIREDRDR